MIEKWIDIKDYEGIYQVSTMGYFKSLDREVQEKNTGRVKKIKGRILGIWKNHAGYNLVTLSKGAKHKGISVHILVAKAFIPNPNNLPEVNHKNGDKDDNRVENLEWCTRLQNQRHSIEVLGKHHAGENHYNAKLTCSQVLEMRDLFKKGGYSKAEIGRMFGVEKDHAINIINNKCWKTLKTAQNEI